MANIVRVVIIAAFFCAISALPAMNGQEEQEKLVDLLSVDDVPQQDVEIASADAGQVRDKRTLFKVKKFLKFGHGKCEIFVFTGNVQFFIFYQVMEGTTTIQLIGHMATTRRTQFTTIHLIRTAAFTVTASTKSSASI